jgi:hypothetical protein
MSIMSKEVFQMSRAQIFARDVCGNRRQVEMKPDAYTKTVKQYAANNTLQVPELLFALAHSDYVEFGSNNVIIHRDGKQ